MKERFRSVYQARIETVFHNITVQNDLLKNISLMDNETPLLFDNISLIDIDRLILYKYRTILEQFILYGNGFIGNDCYQLIYIANDLLLYWLILKNEKELSENEKNTCKVEIERHFYFYLNCIYNIKEKFETFVSKDGDIKKYELKDTVLSTQGQKKVLALFRDVYQIIKRHCEARGAIVHRQYVMEYFIDDNLLKISTFTFNLVEDKEIDKTSQNFCFSLTDETIKLTIEGIYRLRNDFLQIITDLNNIEFPKLKNKFIAEKNGKMGHFITC